MSFAATVLAAPAPVLVELDVPPPQAVSARIATPTLAAIPIFRMDHSFVMTFLGDDVTQGLRTPRPVEETNPRRPPRNRAH